MRRAANGQRNLGQSEYGLYDIHVHNSELAITLVRGTVERLSAKTKFPKPIWLDPGVGWLKELT